jgi:hypothetical protein
MQESGVREIRTLRLMRRGLETWHGRDPVTLADERASNGEHKYRPTPARQSSTLLGKALGRIAVPSAKR